MSNANELLNIAFGHHQAGRLKQAEDYYRRVLAVFPRQFDAMHLLGVVALQTGRLDEAHKLITAALAVSPNSAQALNNLGNVYLRLDRLDEAVASFQRAVLIEPRFGDGYSNLGIALRRQGKLTDAALQLKHAVAIVPQSIQAQANLGAVLLELQDASGAIEVFETVVGLQPNDADARANLGAALSAAGDLVKALSELDRAHQLDSRSPSVLANRGSALARLGRFAEASACFEQAIVLQPYSADAHSNLGALLRDAGSPEKALAPLRRALELDPDLWEARLALAQSLHDTGSTAEAREELAHLLRKRPNSVAALLFEGSLRLDAEDRAGSEDLFRKAAEIQPPTADAHYQLANVLMLGGRVIEARESYRQALSINPHHVRARWASMVAQVAPIAMSASEIAQSRSAFTRELHALDKWFDESRIEEGYKAVGCVQPFYLAYQTQNNRELLSEYGALCVRLMTPWHNRNVSVRPIASSFGRPMRIGIASAHIHDHSVWNAIVKGWIKHLDRERFNIFLFNLGARNDSETSLASQWARKTEAHNRGLAQWSQCIADNELDILIYPEIGMDTMTVRLASQRLAPVQAATWGHPETTGLPTIDYYLSAAGLEPDAADAHYSERLVRLPNLGVCYEAVNAIPVPPDFGMLGLPTDVPLMICAGMPFKYSPEHDDLWIEIARRAGRARIVFFRADGSVLSQRFAERLRSRFAASGIDIDRHVSFIPFLDPARFLGLMKKAHLFLDSPGFSGFNTAMQAIQSGLPIVTLEGTFLRGRFGSGILRRLGMDSMIAATGQAYAELALTLMQDDAGRQRAREQTMAQRHVLFNDLEPIAGLEKFFEEVRAKGS